MHVEVVFHARASRTAEIEAEIITVRAIFTPERVLAMASKIDQFVQFLGSGVLKKRYVAIGHTQQMAGGVRKEVQYDKRMGAAEEDEVVNVSRLAHNAAEYAGDSLFGAADVVKAPRSPESIHYRLTRSFISLPGLK